MDPITLAMGLAQFAPGIIKLLTGSDKAADVADKVISVAQAVTGAPDGSTALATIKSDPDKLLAFQQAMATEQIGLEKAYLVDRQDARGMQEVALGQNDLFSKRYVYYFMSAWSLFSMIYITLVTFFPPSTEAGKSNAATVLGFLLGTAVATMFAFLMGSTDGGKEKSKLLAQSMPPKG